jgi:hypothetical protein
VNPETCRNRLRFRLTDASGVLRFAEFEIVDAPDCKGLEATLRDYLLGRSLADVDLGFLRRLRCPNHCDCMQAVIREVRKHQALFLRKDRKRSARC